MEHDPQAPETQNCCDGTPEEDLPPTTTIALSEAQACYILFVLLSIAGLIALVVYEAVTATGSLAHTVDAIFANLWMPTSFALTFTLTAAAIARGVRFLKRRLRQLLFKYPQE